MWFVDTSGYEIFLSVFLGFSFFNYKNMTWHLGRCMPCKTRHNFNIIVCYRCRFSLFLRFFYWILYLFRQCGICCFVFHFISITTFVLIFTMQELPIDVWSNIPLGIYGLARTPHKPQTNANRATLNMESRTPQERC